ncbi:MAG TPA: DNA polymerase III subunit delta' [Sedimenticola sp.]|nr:DNA polymerase III subunit delta' [Sedimenticola sp.]
MSGLLPWHQKAWQRLQASRQADRLPHALLVSGPAGLGKGRFARDLAASLLCRDPDADGIPCGQCQGCHLFRAGTHPDYRLLAPEEPGKAITVDSIRDYIGSGSLTAQAGGYKVVLIEPAEQLNLAAANSLLKTLEEPVPWTLIVLVSSRPGRLPATIRSRCQRLGMGLPPPDQALDWLRQRVTEADPALLLDLAGGAPLRALALAEAGVMTRRGELMDLFAGVLAGRNDPLEAAANWNTEDPERVLNWCSGWVIDAIRLKATPDPAGLINPDQRQRLQAIGKALEFRTLYGILDKTYEVARTLGSQLNTLLLLEGLLLEVAAAGSRLKRERR